MPLAAYIKITGETQGEITAGASTADSVGGRKQEGNKDEIHVVEIKHQVTKPIDPQSCQATGLRIHKPFMFTSSFNKATPLLYQALAKNEPLTAVEVKWYRTSNDGSPEHFFTTLLKGVTIVSIDCVLPNVLDENNAHFTELLTVALTYRKITWTHRIANTEGSDDWAAPAA